METFYTGKDGSPRKLFTFAFNVGTDNGRKVKTIDVCFRKSKGKIHRFPSNKKQSDLK